MLISSQLLQTALNKYNQTHPNKENYSFAYTAGAGTQAAFVNFAIVVAVVFFILELILLFFAIKMVLDCTEPGPEKNCSYGTSSNVYPPICSIKYPFQ